MRQHRTAFAGACVAVMALAGVAGAQAPRLPGQVIPFQEERTGPPRSDAYRLVGKVLRIDRAQGVVELETEEGRRTVKAPPMLLAAARIGDTVSVERALDDGSYAAPRGESGRSWRRSP
jgi:hypothetical protein